MKRRLFGITTAAVMLAAFSQPGILASAAKLRDDIPAPDWIPSSFEEAYQFECEHGATFMKDDVVCIVTCDANSFGTRKSTAEVKVEEIGRTDIDPYVWENTYKFEPPVKPDDYDTNPESMKAYEKACAELGWDPRYMDERDVPNCQYTVRAYWLFEAPIEVTITLTDPETTAVYQKTTYSFAEDENGLAYETDLFGRVPDSVSEMDAYQKEHGKLSVHDGYIVYMDSCCYDGGYQVFFEQSGNGFVENYYSSFISYPELVPRVGGSSNLVKVFRPVRSGTVLMSFTQKRDWEPYSDDVSVLKQAYSISDDGVITPIDEKDLRPLTPGDCNNDNTITASDAVVMQKYLTGDAEITDWQNIDFDNNGVVNAMDYTLMLRMLAAGSTRHASEGIALSSKLTEKNVGESVTDFSVTFSAVEFRSVTDIKAVSICDADGDAVIAECKPNGGVYRWSGEGVTNVPTPCTKQYYVRALMVDENGREQTVYSAPLSILFYESQIPEVPSDPPVFATIEFQADVAPSAVPQDVIFTALFKSMTEGYKVRTVSLCEGDADKIIAEMTLSDQDMNAPFYEYTCAFDESMMSKTYSVVAELIPVDGDQDSMVSVVKSKSIGLALTYIYDD